MSDQKPWADRIQDEFDAFLRLFKERRRLAIAVIVGLIAVAIYSFVGWFNRGLTISALETQNRELQRDLRQLEAENKGLRETVAPLLVRAAREFPGEEINSSLKKIIEQLETVDPTKRLIASGKATVEIRIRSEAGTNDHFMDQGGYAVFGKGSSDLVLAGSHDSWGKQIGNKTVVYRCVLDLPGDHASVGKPLTILNEAQYIQIELAAMPAKISVLGGQIIWTLNDSLTLRFEIPEQVADEKRVFVRDLHKGLEPFAKK